MTLLSNDIFVQVVGKREVVREVKDGKRYSTMSCFREWFKTTVREPEESEASVFGLLKDKKYLIDQTS